MPTTGQGRRKYVTVVPQTSSPLLDAFTFDLTRSMSINYSADVTSHPVQNGAEGPVDQIVINPATVTVSGVTANTPVQPKAGLSAFFIQVIDAGTERMQTLTQLIVQLHQLKVQCAVYCSWHKPLFNYYPSVVGLSRDQSSGNTIPISVSFSRIRIVTSQTIPAMQDSDILALTQQRVEFGPVAFG